ncbi:unnamed protein product [Clonostachys rosea f. rosea IK726]|uniref:Uncharacterized protein n=1 Tax=Clonostachys rosea f. rosea IK726 TaxID=1349383 RepID=A0ACA9TNM9_BIOOC|nr:unnamed protein product [Clonostachys rosea f. rosea IK726]
MADFGKSTRTDLVACSAPRSALGCQLCWLDAGESMNQDSAKEGGNYEKGGNETGVALGKGITHWWKEHPECL